MKTQIVYVAISSDEDLFLEEFWASLFSLRIYHPEAIVKVLVDEPTAERISHRPALAEMITEVVIVPVPELYTLKERSRQIKTTLRNIIDGPYLYVDSDTVICKPLDELDQLTCDIAAVLDGHLPLQENAFKNSVYDNLKRIFNEDISDCLYWFNAGVMYVADNEKTRSFYRRWNENWIFSAFQKQCSQDQPALVKTDKEFGYIIQKMPDIYNCQVALSLKYYADAAIVHFWHMDFIKDQSYSPFMGLSVYREIKEANGITPQTESLIRHCKSSFESPSMAVGIEQIYFLFSPTGQAFCQLRRESKGWSKFLDWLAFQIIRLHRLIHKIKG